jgi:hypothetical protein
MALDRTWYNTLVDDDGSGLTGSVWDKADVDSLMDVIDAELDGALNGASLYAVSDAAIATGWNLAPLGSTDYNAGYVQGAGQFLIPGNKGGLYLFTGAIAWMAVASGTRQISLQQNGVAKVSLAVPVAVTGVNMSFAALLPCLGGDSVVLYLYQDVATTILAGSRYACVRI